MKHYVEEKNTEKKKKKKEIQEETKVDSATKSSIKHDMGLSENAKILME